jgi:hypothetical protein
MFCYIGATASTFTDGTTSASNSIVHTVILIVGVLFAIAGAAVASYYSKIELDKIIMTETRMDRDDFAPLDTIDPTIVAEDESQPPLRPIGDTPLT